MEESHRKIKKVSIHRSKSILDLLKVIYSNLFVFISGMFTFYFLPNMLGPSQYGYWQLFTFYYVYIGFLGLGYCDGILVKYGGKDYHELDKPTFRSYTAFIIGIELFFSILFLMLSMLMVKDVDKRFIFLSLSVVLFLANVNVYFSYITQVTQRFSLYSFTLMAEKFIFVGLMVLLVLIKVTTFKPFIIAQTLAWIIVLAIYLYKMRDLVFGERLPFLKNLSMHKENFGIGVPLMLANILAMLIPGIGRFLVEQNRGIESFSYFSFAFIPLSLSMLTISAVSTVLYPILSRISSENIFEYKKLLDTGVVALGAIMLLLYYPLTWIVQVLVPKYTLSLLYMPFIFPILLYDLRNYIIINNYYKVLKKQNKMLQNNIVCVIITLLINIVLFKIFNSITAISIATLISYCIWSHYAEIVLIRQMNIPVGWDSFLDVFIIMIFIACEILFPTWKAMGVYGLIILSLAWTFRKKFIVLQPNKVFRI